MNKGLLILGILFKGSFNVKILNILNWLYEEVVESHYKLLIGKTLKI